MHRNERPTLRPSPRPSSLLGGLLLAAALLTTPLGVSVARADGAEDWTRSPLFSLGGVKDASPGQCNPGQTPARQANRRSDAMAQVMARVQAELAAGGDHGVVLNGRGYNYRNGTDPWVQLERIQREAAQARQ